TGIHRSSAARMSNARPDSVRSIIRFRSSATSLSIGLGADAGSGPDCISLHGIDSSFPSVSDYSSTATRMARGEQKTWRFKVTFIRTPPGEIRRQPPAAPVRRRLGPCPSQESIAIGGLQKALPEI